MNTSGGFNCFGMEILRMKITFMRSPLKFSFFILLTLLSSAAMLFAQSNPKHLGTTEKQYRVGVSLFEEGNYGSAIHLFEELRSKENGILSEAAEYYIAVSRLELGNPNGEAELRKFVKDQPASPLLNSALFRLANLSFNRKNYKEALQLYQKIEAYSLPSAEHDKFIYNSGICLLETGENAKAKANFNQLRNQKGALGDGSKYYWAHINYLEGSYDASLTEFNKLENTPLYFKIIPYYQIQISFAKSQYREVVKQGVTLLAKAPEDRKFELARVLVTSYYQLQEYDLATELVDKYFKTKEISRADCYVAGFCEEKSGQTEVAISWYEKSIQQKDAIAQGTYYQLGEIGRAHV